MENKPISVRFGFSTLHFIDSSSSFVGICGLHVREAIENYHFGLSGYGVHLDESEKNKYRYYFDTEETLNLFVMKYL